MEDYETQLAFRSTPFDESVDESAKEAGHSCKGGSF